MNKEKFDAYVEVQESGVTNMFNLSIVSEFSGLTNEECIDIMKNYGKYKEMYGG